MLRLGPLAGTVVKVAEPFAAIAVPIGEVAAGLAIYAYVMPGLDPKATQARIPAGDLRYVFERVRPHTEAELRLFGVEVVEVVAA
jgi:hypothetical protein